MDELVFKRIEQKYLITKSQYNNIISDIESYTKKDKYYSSNIHNIYFDNKNHDLVIKSLDSPTFKYKVRLRSYTSDNDKVFLEMKCKYKSTVYKRRLALTIEEYNKYINNKILPNHDVQIMSEIDYVITKYNLFPTILIAYDRYSYLGDNDLRITFDYNLRSREDNLDIKADKANTFYFSNDTYIMEIKTSTNYPLWLTKCLTNNHIFPVPFSKYGKIYQKNLKEMK